MYDVILSLDAAVRVEHRQLAQEHNVLAVCRTALGQHGDLGHYLAAGLMHQRFHGLQAAAGGASVVMDWSATEMGSGM